VKRNHPVRNGIAAGLVLLASAISTPSSAAEDSHAFFESKIRPALVEHCYECHSADQKQKGGLVLDTRDGLRSGGDTGPAIVAGAPDKSLLIKALKHQGDLQMPPKKRLPEPIIADFEQWIREGAPDPRDGKRKPSLVEDLLEKAPAHWAFIAPKPSTKSLDDLAGTTGKPVADKRTLIRRASLDLLGVPPSYEQVVAFQNDSRPDAFARLVERLLDDPRYGERWGRHWLDVARYADSMGAIFNGDDSYPFSFTYRDYVIRAFNEDKPYDRFILEQIAADHLDSAKDPSTLAALGFLGIGPRKDRRLDDDTIDDTLDAIGRGLLGLSIGCARCHDHKLEPITTKDYYGLYAVMKSSREPEILPTLPQEESPDVLEYRTKNQEARAEYLRVHAFEADRSLTALRSRLGDYLAAAEQAKFKTIYEEKTVKPDLLDPQRLSTAPHNRLVKSWDKWVKGHPEIFTPWLELSALTPETFAEESKTRCETYAKNADKKLLPPVARLFTKAAPRDMRDIAFLYNQLYASQVEALWGEKWREPLRVACTPTPEELDLPAKELEFRAIERVNSVQRTNALPEADEQNLRAVFIEDGSPFFFTGRDFVSSQLYQTRDVADGIRRNAAKAVTTAAAMKGAPIRAMAWIDTDKPYNGKVFVRGNPRTLGADAPRAFLSVLKHVAPKPFPTDKSGRLELANAIASKENPLTARVIVNRVWNWHFGAPLVGTPSDFGFRGDQPSNQELLDHLATWFVANGWSFKKLHRHLMNSAAYQRTDFGVRPLELEPARDSILFVAGRLSDQVFGKAEKLHESTRRTVYGYVDRRMPSALYRSFDFPDPSFSAASRGRTALAPRALILMNSPLTTESAKALARSLAEEKDDSARVISLFRRTLQRDPSPREIERSLSYLSAYPPNDLVHPEQQTWQYGYGEFDPASKNLKGFSALTSFDGKAWKASPKLADGKSSGVMLDAMGGDPGPGKALSTVRRWTAPLDGQIAITAELVHSDAKSEGVTARILSDRQGILGEWKAKTSALSTDLPALKVSQGEHLDFVVSSQSDADAGAYQWSPTITMPASEMPGMKGTPRRWDARTDFADPGKPQRPLSALEELCHTLLLSPEFAVLE
jgi:mono/diheme cytochrome c family protein